MKYVADGELFMGAYSILYCFAKSSRDSIGVSRRDTVKKAARLAVYDETIINPKSHHTADAKRPERFFGASPPPCGVKDVIQNHKHSFKVKSLLSLSPSYFFGLFLKLQGLILSKNHMRKLKNDGDIN